MVSSRVFRQSAVLAFAAMFAVEFVVAQPPQGGNQPPQEGRQRGDRQGGRGGFGGGGFAGGMMSRGGVRIDRATLLQSEQVKTELKIEEAQAVTIETAIEAYREERNNAPRLDRDAIANMSEEERTEAFEKSRKEREELSKKTDDILNALLEPEQVSRLDQLQFQARLMMGPVQTFKSDDIKEKLKITDEQVAKLTEVEEAAAEEMRNMFGGFGGGGGGRGRGENGGGAPPAGGPPAGGGAGGGPGGGFEQIRTMMEEARKKSTEAAMAVLTDEQKAQVEEMKGAAFEFDLRSLMGGRGGFGGGGFGGGPGGGGPDGGGPGGGRGGRGTRPPSE